MAGNFENFLGWFSANADTLAKIGAALVVMIGGLWQAYLYFDGRAAKQKSTILASPPVSGNITVVVPSPPLPPTGQRPPLIAMEGRYRFSNYVKEQRRFMLFRCVFIAFCCISFFWVGSIAVSELPIISVAFTFVLFLMFAHYMGMVGFLSQVTLLIGKARVYIDADMILISRSLLDVFSSHTVILASEWRFDGNIFVSRKDGIKTAIPELPEYVSSAVIKALLEAATWR